MVQISQRGPIEIVSMVIARFLCKKTSNNTWVVSPKAAGFCEKLGYAVSKGFQIAPTDEWKSYKDLGNVENLKAIHEHRELFADVMARMVEEIPKEIEAYTYRIRPEEYRILLVYCGLDVYDFFVEDHRFGPPPRGKVYRSNVRGPWGLGNTGRKRPDMALVALKRKIGYQKALGADVVELEAEYRRREECLKRGEDPLLGKRRYARLGQSLSREQMLEILREQSGVTERSIPRSEDDSPATIDVHSPQQKEPFVEWN